LEKERGEKDSHGVFSSLLIVQWGGRGGPKEKGGEGAMNTATEKFKTSNKAIPTIKSLKSSCFGHLEGKRDVQIDPVGKTERLETKTLQKTGESVPMVRWKTKRGGGERSEETIGAMGW